MRGRKEELTFRVEVCDNGYLLHTTESRESVGKTYICVSGYDVTDIIRKLIDNEVEQPRQSIASYA